MNNEKHAAQPVLTDDEIKAIRDRLGGGFLGPAPFARAIESAVLSKLRAEGVPVADGGLTHRCANCSAVFQGAGCPSCRLAAPVASAPADERAAFSRAEISFPLMIPGNRVYLAGPMTGYENHNFPAFHAAAERLRGLGLEVVNPADHGLVDGLAWADYMRWDLVKLAGCHSVYVLPGWEKSKGASLEVAIARALGILVFTVDGAALAIAPVEPEAAEVDFMVRVFKNLDTWRAEEWNELLEHRPAILRLLRPLVLASAPVAGEACAWFTEDHLTDKSATTWDRTVAERWRAKGWPVRPLVYGDAAPQASEAGRPALAVWYGSMPESNGKSNWTAILHRKSDKPFDGPHITIERSEYPDRVRYEADRVRYIIGELDKEPFVLDYDADKCDAQPQADKDGGQQRARDADMHEQTRDVLQWIVDDAASGGVAKLRPQQEKRARAALSATQTEQGEREDG